MPSPLSSTSTIVTTTYEATPEQIIAHLLAHIAQLEEDKVELQKATVTAKEEAERSHHRFQEANRALANYKLSYARRIQEKGHLIVENASKERVQLASNERIAGYAPLVSDMTNKLGETEKEDDQVQERVAQMEKEKDDVQRRVDELEVREQRSAARDAGDGRTRQESYTPRYENQRSRYNAGRDARRRSGRGLPAFNARFDPSKQPPAGPRAERR